MKTEQVEQINAEQFGLKLQVLNKIICQFLNKTLSSQSFLRTCATHNIIILIIQTPEITKKTQFLNVLFIYIYPGQQINNNLP